MVTYSVGDKAICEKKISENDISQFAELTGDYNPLHVSVDEAEKSIFGRRIAHGFLVGGIISMVIGMKLPGPNTIYLEQNMRFVKPVYIDDVIKVCVEVVEIIDADRGILRLDTYVTNQDGENVIEGYAKVKASC